MARAQQTAGLDPANFLIAAADMHNSGQLSAPVPQGKDLLARSKPGKKIRVVK